MTSELSYLELGRRSESSWSGLQVVFTNGAGPFEEEVLRRWEKELANSSLSLRTAFLDARGQFADAESLHRFLVGFPNARFFLPHEAPDEAAALNLFVAETREPLFLLVPSGVLPGEGGAAGDRVRLDEAVERFASEDDLFSVPLGVLAEGKDAETSLVPVRVGRRIELARRAFQDGIPSGSPFRLGGLYDRSIWNDLGGLDRRLGDDRLSGLDLVWRASAAGFSSRFSAGFSARLETIAPSTPVAKAAWRRFRAKNVLDEGGSGSLSEALRLRFHEAGLLRELRAGRAERRILRRRNDDEILASFRVDA